MRPRVIYVSLNRRHNDEAIKFLAFFIEDGLGNESGNAQKYSVRFFVLNIIFL